MKKEVFDKIAALVTAAFALVAALAWNEAVKSLFNEGGVLHFLAGYGVWIYAFVVTIIAVIVTIWVGRITSNRK